MKPRYLLAAPPLFAVLLCLISCTSPDKPSTQQSQPKSARTDLAQVQTWSRADLDFFLHGSLGTEVIPEKVLRAFIRTYPDLFPQWDLSNFGLIPDLEFRWPVGFSRTPVPHLGGLSSVGLNCAVCHVGEITPKRGGKPVRVLGMTSNFDAEAFLGSVIVATFRTADTNNMKRFLRNYLRLTNYDMSDATRVFDSEWARQESKILEAISADPFGSKAVAAGELHDLNRSDVSLDYLKLANGELDLAALSHSMLKLFHNMRAALHVPDQPPPASPPNGPGRNDPWRILAYSLLGVETKVAPVKFGVVWNEDQRRWVHVDGNTRSPIIRNLAASLGLGAPLIGNRGVLDFSLVQRQTDLSEKIRPPRYPWAIDRAAASRGAKTYSTLCSSCHDGPETDQRLYEVDEIKTDPNRAEIFTPEIADKLNKFFTDLEVAGYRPPPPALRSTQKYWAPSMAGVWARSPYLHNGSVRTMQELLTTPAARAKTSRRGSRVYDAAQMGYADDGTYLFDTNGVGNSNTGHDYGTDLANDQKRELIEYLKTL